MTDRIARAGIRLAGAKQLVELHGGRITIESVADAGATVAVRLPGGINGDTDS